MSALCPLSLKNAAGMTAANVKIVTLGTTSPDQLKPSDAEVEEGEHTVKRVAALEDFFYDILKVRFRLPVNPADLLTDSCLLSASLLQRLR